jgi:hypothetical protein
MKYIIAIFALTLSLSLFAEEPAAGPKGCPVGAKGEKGEAGKKGCCFVRFWTKTVGGNLKKFAGHMEHDVGGGLKTGARKTENFFTGGTKEEDLKNKK